MGMRDESWCNGCGTSVPYSEAEENYCGECGETNGRNDILSYIKDKFLEHQVALESISESMWDNSDRDYHEGASEALEHILAKFGANNG